MKITAGKLKRLKAVADRRGVIAAVAVDQRGSLQKSIAKEMGVALESVTPEMLSEFKVAVSRVLTSYVSAILLDPEVGLDAISVKSSEAGVLLAYEQTGYDQTQPGRIPSLVPFWTARKSLEAGADCLKLLLYYSPFEEDSIKEIKHAFVERVGAECEYAEIPFFLEIVTYDPHGGFAKGADYARLKPLAVSKSMEEFSKPHYQVDVFKVEIPVNLQFVEGSRANTRGESAYSRQQAIDHFQQAAASARRPFIFLSAGVSNAEFRESLALAVEAGVDFAGVLCGRATWKDGVPVYARQGLTALEDWLSDKGVKNIQALNEVLDGARAWFSKYGGADQIQQVDKAGNKVA